MNDEFYENFLYEVIEDYQQCLNNEDKDSIFRAFCDDIWSCQNKRRTFLKDISYTIRDDLAETEVGKVLSLWTDVEYRTFKSKTNNDGYVYLIRQKINNLFTKYCDKSVVLNKKYFDALCTAKNIYFSWKNGTKFSADEVCKRIDDAMDEAKHIEEQSAKQKLEITWNDYKNLVEKWLRKCFDEYYSVYDVADEEEEDEFNSNSHWNEDMRCVRYICTSLDGRMRNFQKEYYGLYRPGARSKKHFWRCEVCGCLFMSGGHNHKRCPECQKEYRRSYDRNRKRTV